MARAIEQRRCHVCGQRSLRRVQQPYEYEVSHDGRPPVKITIPDLEVVACTNPNCRPDEPGDNIIHDDATAERITLETYRQLGLLTPDEIRTKRRALGLKQSEFQERLGLGGNTLSRWEKGRVYQSRAMDKFLRLFFASKKNRNMLEALAEPIGRPSGEPTRVNVRGRAFSRPFLSPCAVFDASVN